MTRGPSALQTIKNGSVVSRARSVRTTEDRAVQAAIENIPPSRVKMLDQQAPAYQQQQAYAPAQQSNDSSISAKTIIGTLLGATAGAALAYAMIKGDSSSNSSSPPQSSAPVPAPAPSQYIQQPLPPQQQQQQQQPQQRLQQQPHQMSMSLPMLMPMLGPAPGYQEQQQQQQPVYRALEAPPNVLAPSQAARSVYTANDAISAYTRSTAPKSKSPRADTIYEETEYYPPITEGSVPRSLYSQESSTINGGGSSGGVRRTSTGSIYATRELPIRAIEYGMSTVSSGQHSQSRSDKVRSKSYPCDPSTFISSYAETRQQQQQQGHIIGEAESDFSSISTIKPVAKSVASSHRSSATMKSSSKHSTHRHEEDYIDARGGGSTASSTRTSASAAHKVALPDSRPGSTYTSTTKTSKRSSASTIKDLRRDRDLVDAYDIPLPASAAPSTVFLDAVVDITPEDSISQVGVSSHSHQDNSNKSSSGRSHRSRSGPSSQSQSPSSASKREKDEDSGSKFDQPLKPSDSISQVSSNHRHSSHHSHHSHSHGGHRGSSKVSSGERSGSGKKSHSGGSVRSGHY